MEYLTPPTIHHRFNSKNYRLVEFDTIDSTNDFLKQTERIDETGVIVSANVQTVGRGRFSRRWENSGTQIQFSFVCRPTFKNVSFFSLVAGLSVFRVLYPYRNMLQLKWPNDILLYGRKICGILCETVIKNNVTRLIVGIGINLQGDPSQFPLSLQQKAGFLFSENASIPQKRDVKCAVYGMFATYLDKLERDDGRYKKQFVKEWERHSCSCGKKIRVRDADRRIEGIFESIDENGFIELRTPQSNLIKIITGDVEFI